MAFLLREGDLVFGHETLKAWIPKSIGGVVLASILYMSRFFFGGGGVSIFFKRVLHNLRALFWCHCEAPRMPVASEKNAYLRYWEREPVPTPRMIVSDVPPFWMMKGTLGL